MENKNGFKLLVCGSERFDDSALVFNTLEAFFIQTRHNIAQVVVSPCSGACHFARQWAEQKNALLSQSRIEIAECNFLNLQDGNRCLYDEPNVTIPSFLLQSDPFFQHGKEEMIKRGINLVLAFPNAEGILGASTRNIQRFANLASIPVFDCSALLEQLKMERQRKAQEIQQAPSGAEELGFKNRLKKF